MLKSVALCLTIFVFYVSLFTRSHYWDGVLFSLYIERAASGELSRSVLFHPNHLLYSAAGFVLYDMFSALNLRAITCLQLGNAVCGTAAAMLLHSMARKIVRSDLAALICTILFAFGATWWKFSTDGGGYVPTVLLVMLAVRAALAGRVAEASGFHIAAMLLHELSIFAYAPLVFAFACRRWRNALLYIVITACCTLLAYELVFRSTGPHSQQTLLAWMTSFSGEAKMTHAWAQILKTYPLSYLKLFGGGKFSLVRDFFSYPVAVSLISAIVLLIAGLWLLRRPSLETRPPETASRNLKTTLWLWILPYALFLAWWEPGNAFYKLFCWPPIVLLIGLLFAERTWWRQREPAFLAFSVALAAWNFGAYIYPHTKAAADPVYALALRIDKELPENAKVFYAAFSPDDWYLDYFAPGRLWQALPSGNLAKEAPFCMETTALADLQVNLSGLDQTKSWKLINSKYHVQLSCFQQANAQN